MSTPAVRGYWLSAALSSLDSCAGREIRERTWQRLSGRRQGDAAEPSAGEWVKREWLTEVLGAVESASPATTHDTLVACGERAADFACGHFLEIVIDLVTVELLSKKLPRIWRIDCQNSGLLEVDLHAEDRRARIVATGVAGFEHLGPLYLGWLARAFRDPSGGKARVRPDGWTPDSRSADVLAWELRWA